MKKLTLFAIALLASVVSFAALNPYAYGLSSKLSADETTLTVNYSLNAPATAVSVVILDGEIVVKTVDCADKGLTQGAYTVEIPTTDFPKTKSLTWKVEVKGESVATPTIQDTKFNFYLPYGLDCDVDPESDYLGNWYVIEANTHSKVGYVSYDTQRGLYAFDATLTGIKNKNGTYGFTGGMNVGALTTDKNSAGSLLNFYRVATSGGRVFIGRFRAGDAYHPIVEANPADLNANFTSVYTLGEAVSIDAIGHGEDLKIVMLTKDLNVQEFDLGTAKSIASPSRTLSKTNVGIVRTDATIAYDNEGGVWFNQHRVEATTTCATIAHLTANGVDYHNVKAELTHNNCDNSGIAVSPDGKQLAVVGAGTQKLTIYTISKDNTGKISLTKKHTISTAGKNHTALSYDYAGNLYVANRSAETITFYAMPYSGMVATPAASKYAFQLQGEVQGTFYTLTTNVDATMGEVTGNAGQYLEGTEATITAVANRGHKFLNWTVGEETKTENPLTFTVNSDLTVTANFEALPAYTITATANDAAMGSVAGAGTYYEGETITLTATANTGYKFVNWSNNETANPLTFTATEDVNLTANFEALSYTITVLTNDENKGTVEGAGTYKYGDKVSLTATPAKGYILLGWNNHSTDHTQTITVKGNETHLAYFTKEYKSAEFNIEKVWENTTIPTSTNNGYQAAGWDGKVYIKDRLNQAIWTYSSETDSTLYMQFGNSLASSSLNGDQPLAIDNAGNIVIRSGSAFFYDAPTQVTIFRKGEKEGKVINLTLPATGRCDFISASGDLFSEEGGYVYFLCQNQKSVSRLFVKNGGKTAADIVVDKVANMPNAAGTQSHVIVDIYGNIHTQSKNVGAYEYSEATLEAVADPYLGTPTKKTPNSTIGGCTFEFGGKELWAYPAGTTDFSSEWELYNATDKTAISDILYIKDNTSAFAKGSSNWLNVQVVDEKTAYIYQFSPTVGIAVWKLTCTLEEIKEDNTTTSLEDIETAPQAQKVLRNGQVLIIRDDKTFNMMGQEVK